MQGLTGRQSEVLDTIRHHLAEKGYPPTIRELGASIGVRSTNGVNDHLQALERKGYITRAGEKSRGIQLTQKARGDAVEAPVAAHDGGTVRVDVYERVAAGAWPFLPHNVVESVVVDRALLRNARAPFGVRARGDSMRDAGILEGDTVFFSRQSEVQRGEVVCVVVGDEAVLRFIFPERDYVRLQPANPAAPPLLVRAENWHPRLVLGVARGMLRRVACAA